MPLFAWDARTSSDELRSGELAGLDEIQVIEALRRRGLRVTRVERSTRRPPTRAATEAPPAALLAALRQYMTLRTAGVGVAEALDLGARGSRGAVAQTLHATALAVESGAGLGEALAQHPTTLGALGARALAEADARGVLDPTLAALVEQLTRAGETRLALRRAVTGPLVAAAICLGCGALVSAVAVPAVGALYLRLGIALTGPLARLLAIAPWLSLGTAISAGLLVFGCAALTAAPALRGRLAALHPGLASALQGLALARFARALAVLTTAEAPRLLALELASWEADDHDLTEATGRARAAISHGGDLGDALIRAGLPLAFARAVQAAERSGDLPQTLRRLADGAEDDAIAKLSSATCLIRHVLNAISLALLAAAALVLAGPLL